MILSKLTKLFKKLINLYHENILYFNIFLLIAVAVNTVLTQLPLAKWLSSLLVLSWQISSSAVLLISIIYYFYTVPGIRRNSKKLKNDTVYYVRQKERNEK